MGCAGLRAILSDLKFGVEVQLQVCLGSLDLQTSWAPEGLILSGSGEAKRFGSEF